jgi:hypothetical protein
LLTSGVKNNLPAPLRWNLCHSFTFNPANYTSLVCVCVCVCVCVFLQAVLGGAHNSFLPNRSQQDFPVLPADISSPSVRTRPLGVTKVTGTSRATSPPSEPQTSQDEVSKRILFHALTLRDLYITLQQRKTSCLRLQSSAVNTRTGIFRVSSRDEAETDVSGTAVSVIWVNQSLVSKPTSKGVHSSSTLQNYKPSCCQW